LNHHQLVRPSQREVEVEVGVEVVEEEVEVAEGLLLF
jgi:hypothetical protein